MQLKMKKDALTRLTQAKETALNDINQAKQIKMWIQHLLVEFKIFKIHKLMLGKARSQNYD